MNRYAYLAVAALLSIVAPGWVWSEDVSYELSGIEARLNALDRNFSGLLDDRARRFALPEVNPAEYVSYAIQEQEEPPLSFDERIKALERASRQQADEEARDKEANALKPTQRWTGKEPTAGRDVERQRGGRAAIEVHLERAAVPGHH